MIEFHRQMSSKKFVIEFVCWTIHRALFFGNPNFEEIRDIYLMRIKLAELIGQMSPNPVLDRHHQIAQELEQQAQQLSTKFNIVDYWFINHDQHYLVSEIIGNGALRKMCNHFYYLSARIWYQYAKTDSHEATQSLICETSEMSRSIGEKNVSALGFVQSNYISYGLSKLEKHNQVM